MPPGPVPMSPARSDATGKQVPMAKGKNSAALFEVINKSKGLKPGAAGQRSGGLATPRWWFGKAKPTPPTSEASRTSAPPPAVSPARASSEKPSASVAPASAVATPAGPELARDRSAPPAQRPVVATPGGDDEQPGGIRVDNDLQEIRFKLSFTTAAVLAFTLVVLIGVAVMVGRSWTGRGSVATGSETTTALLSGPADPGVLDARPGQRGSNAEDAAASPPGAGGSTAPQTGIPPRPPQNTSAAPDQPAAQGGRESRVVGMNYIIVQSYDASEAAEARAVVDLLASKGVPATVESNLTGFGKRLVVVSGEGFARVNSPEYQKLRRQIDQISADQAQRDRRFRRFEPTGYRWR